ncbi:putative ubiquitin-protein ligase bre1 [Operophtera brumata]|uniref:Putative ubiquitin-protein ligase bre1 n=1 Tax=Operophtera brumata TaxID=104452 RepID=A0A0L7KSG1_OPEBR|nr:putative ubiquitin-protein ligase bre1 [Operophtera brumata]
MVYYYTSGNVKMLRNIILDYSVTSDVSPYEYMKTYIEQCPDATEDTKVSWIADTFLNIQKHNQFLKAIASHMSEELSKEDQDYFMIIFHSLIYHIGPKEMQYLYKCIFNLSKHLLNTMTNFLSNNEVFNLISQVAQSYYDTNYVTDKIIGPLFTWQPYISEMAHSYAEYIKRTERRKMKPLTVPIQPNVLNRKDKGGPAPGLPVTFPATPPNSLRVKGTRKLQTKSMIDQKLKCTHEKNKQRATIMLNEVRTRDFHFAQDKSERYYATLENIRDQMENDFKPLPKQSQKFSIKNPQQPVKETATTLKRMHKRIQLAEEEEVLWLQNLMSCCNNTTKVEELEGYDRQEKERERLYDIERKHLVGQISHEEALIAKKKLQEENKKKYEEFLKEKETWDNEIETWKKIEIEKNRKRLERNSLIELNLLQARNNVAIRKKEIANTLKKESEAMLREAIKVKQEELEKKIEMIKEIKVLALIAKKAKVPKIIDLTETSGLGLLCEMSMAELQERLTVMKIGLDEELERKKKLIKNENLAAQQELENTKTSIKNYKKERAVLRKQNKKQNMYVEGPEHEELKKLKKILEEKRKLRINLTN